MTAAAATACLCIEMRSAAQSLTRRYDEALAPAGISVTQFSQLHTIQTLHHPTIGNLAAATNLDRSTLGRNVRTMETMGLVEVRAGADARTRTLHLTRKGKNAFNNAAPLWQAVQTELANKLGHERRAVLQGLLAELTATA